MGSVEEERKIRAKRHYREEVLGLRPTGFRQTPFWIRERGSLLSSKGRMDPDGQVTIKARTAIRMKVEQQIKKSNLEANLMRKL